MKGKIYVIAYKGNYDKLDNKWEELERPILEKYSPEEYEKAMEVKRKNREVFEMVNYQLATTIKQRDKMVWHFRKNGAIDVTFTEVEVNLP